MSLVVIGLNHRTVPLDLLERTTVDAESLPKALDDLLGRPNISEAVVLSTCNRTEVYVHAERFHGAYHDVRSSVCERAFLAPEELSHHLYVHFDREAAAHLFRVAAGVDSAVLGEGEILGQVRTAWERAQEHQATGPVLNMLFRHSLEVGKRARSETDIARHIASVSHAAVVMAEEHLGGFAGRRVLVLGAGEMGRGMTTVLAEQRVGDFLVANRTHATAEQVAADVGGRAVRLHELADALVGVDVVFTSTGASSILLEHAELAPVMAARGHRPLLIVDVAVPRDVDPAAAGIPGVTLLDMDDLRRFTERGLAERRREVSAVGAIVDEELERWSAAASAREVAPLVASLHRRAEQVRAAEVERFAHRLAELTPEQREAVEALTRGLVGKLVHAPTVRVKGAAGTPRGERLADSLRDLFEL